MGSNVKLSLAISAVLGSYSIEVADAVAADDTDSSSALGEIIVTAQRRSENLQDVPISITVLDSKTLRRLDVRSSDELAQYVPSVQIAMPSGRLVSSQI